MRSTVLESEAKSNLVAEINQFSSSPRSAARTLSRTITLDPLPQATQLERKGGKQTMVRWTKEQDEALGKAFDSVKPTPSFWRDVAKQLQGKSAQDCFDRFYCLSSIPVNSKRQPKAKKMKSPSPEKVSVSPTKKRARMPNSRKQKNQLTRKHTVKLDNRSEVDDDLGEDLFSVLEPDVKFSSNALQPSDEEEQLVEICSGASSSSHKKSLSTSGNSSSTNPPNPPALKKRKKKSFHEKYIDKLVLRNARREAAERAKKFVTENPVNEESNRKNEVMVAREALLSSATDAMNKFQQSQAVMGNGYGSDDGDDYEDDDDADAEDENY